MNRPIEHATETREQARRSVKASAEHGGKVEGWYAFVDVQDRLLRRISLVRRLEHRSESSVLAKLALESLLGWTAPPFVLAVLCSMASARVRGHRRNAARLAHAQAHGRNQGQVDGLVDLVSWLIPRRQREVVLGDLREDVAELRASCTSERRIFAFVLWQLLIIVLQRPILWKAALWTWIGSAVKRWLSS